MVTRTREGTRVRYALAGDEVLRLWLALREASALRLAEVERAAREYLGGDVEAIGRDELVKRLARGDVVLVDVRPREEYAAGHIEGARSVPLDELERRLAELPSDREIVAYCRGPFCAYAHEAVRRLRAEGRSARRLKDGWPNGASRPSAAQPEQHEEHATTSCAGRRHDCQQRADPEPWISVPLGRAAAGLDRLLG
jgi:rhodanese-related sulfurtransferase